MLIDGMITHDQLHKPAPDRKKSTESRFFWKDLVSLELDAIITTRRTEPILGGGGRSCFFMV